MAETFYPVQCRVGKTFTNERGTTEPLLRTNEAKAASIGVRSVAMVTGLTELR